MDPKEPVQIIGMDTDFICQIDGVNTNALANARLIAAAPELLDALRWFATCAEPEDDGTLSRKDLEHASKRASEVLAKLKDITL